MTDKEKLEKLLNFAYEIYSLKFDIWVSVEESCHNQYLSERAEKILKEIGDS